MNNNLTELRYFIQLTKSMSNDLLANRMQKKNRLRTLLEHKGFFLFEDVPTLFFVNCCI